MCGAREDGGFPFLAGEEEVVLDFLFVFGAEVGAEGGVGEAGLVADAGGERDVGVVEVGGAPGEGPGVEGDDEDFIAVGFGAVEELVGG